MRVHVESVHYRVTVARPGAWGPGRPAWGLGRPGWVPACDVYETEDRVVVLCEAAGIDEEALQVTVFPDAVVVRGYRPPLGREALAYHVAEIGFGPFQAEVSLPCSVDPQGAQLRYERGLVAVSLPKRGVG